MNNLKMNIIKEFLSKEEVNKLLEDFDKFSKNDLSTMHGGRIYLPNTDEGFINLVQNSVVWNALYEKLNSQYFFEMCSKKLGVEYPNLLLKKFFTRSLKGFILKVHNLRTKRVRDLSFKAISAYYIYFIIRYSYFQIRRFFYFIIRKSTIELLFDISSAENGYSREIHRDSDGRCIVFLLYLNSLEGQGTGGTLNLYDYIGSDLSDPPPQPNINECKLLHSISAEPGTLVILLNNNFSFHSVPIMNGYSNKRLFCYGSFTVTAGKNPALNISKYKLSTEWRIWI
jgi:hypothetical protein